MKVPPQTPDIEQAVIGAMMLDRDAVTTAIDILTPDAFYKHEHKCIYEAIVQLFAENSGIDILTVSEKLKKMGTLDQVGGLVGLVEITGTVGSSAHVEHHARIISQKYIQRELIRIGEETARDGYDDSLDVFDLLDKTENSLFQVAQQNLKREVKNLSTLTIKAQQELEAIMKGDKAVGLPSGYDDLDKITHGWQKSDLIIIAGRPAMGKTAFALSVAKNVALQNNAVAIFSLEMSDIQLAKRLVSQQAKVEGDKMRSGNLTADEVARISQANNVLSEANILIDDTPALGIFELRAKCRRLKMKHDIQLILVDYLQLMTTSGNQQSREQEISTISRSLKAIAKEINVPVIALSQLSRKVEDRSDKKPLLSDLRESGAIEQDADIVMFLYRPEYYKITEDADGNSVLGVAKVLIAKHRNGNTGEVNLRFINEFARFENFSEQPFQEERDEWADYK